MDTTGTSKEWEALQSKYGDDPDFACRKAYEAELDINGTDVMRMIGFELATIADALLMIVNKGEE